MTKTLRDYVHHDDDCPWRWHARDGCDCGLDALLAQPPDAPPTEAVEAATAHLSEQIQNRADELHVSGYSRDVHRAIDALIAAVRAEYRPEPCADHPTAEMVTVCEACIEEQIAAVRASAVTPEKAP